MTVLLPLLLLLLLLLALLLSAVIVASSPSLSSTAVLADIRTSALFSSSQQLENCPCRLTLLRSLLTVVYPGLSLSVYLQDTGL